MTRLLIASGIFHPESGGPATYLYHLLPGLQAQGFEVQVITYSDDNPTEDYPYPVTRIPRGSLLARRIGYATAARPLLRWADLVYMHTLDLPLLHLPYEKRVPRVLKIVGDTAWERAMRRGWVPPDTDIDRFQIMRYRHPMVRQGQNARRDQVRAADGVIVPSRYLLEMVRQWGVPPQRLKLIYNALPPDHTPATVSQAEARAQLGLPADRPTLLTVGRLVPWKGVDAFIQALGAVPNLRLLVAGDGAERPALEQLAISEGVSNRVEFLGRVSRAQMPLYMRAADYVGLYSGYEGLPHVLLEALRAGTPVIASQKGGNPEVVQHEVNGLLVPYENPDALRAALVRAFGEGLREQLAAHTQVGLERFDHDRMLLETVAALRQFGKLGE